MSKNEESKATMHSYMRDIDGGVQFFCRHCHEPRLFTRDGSMKFISTHSLKDKDIICKNCLKTSFYDETLKIAGDRINNFFRHATIQDNGDKVRLTIFSKEVTIYNQKIQEVNLFTMIVFNTKTGQTYLFEPRYSKTNKRWRRYLGPPLRNINIGHFPEKFLPEDLSLDSPVVAELISLLEEKISNRFNFKIKPIQDYKNEYMRDKPIWIHEESILSLAIYNRFPTVNPFSFYDFVQSNYSLFGKGVLPRILRQVRPNSDQPIKDLAIAFKVADVKSIRKLIMGSFDMLPYLYAFHMIKDINNLCSIVNAMYHRRLFIASDPVTTIDHVVKFTEAMLKQISENTLTKKIIRDTRNYIFLDSARMYILIKELKPDYIFDASRSIQAIHDTLSLDFSKITQENIEIDYRDKEKQIECEIDGYDFRLPKDTHELISVGSYMNICVGSYGAAAVRKNLYIVIAYKDNEPVVCLELDRQLKIVDQAKTKYNDPPTGDLLSTCLKFVQEKDLKVRTSDLPVRSIGLVG